MKIVNMNEIKYSLERMRCPKCSEHPTISVVGDSLKISCCCETFKELLNKTAETEISKQTRQNIEKQLKNIFK